MPAPVTAERGADHDRHDRAGEHLVRQCALQLGDRRCVPCEVALELVIVVGDHVLDQGVVEFVLLIGDVRRRVDLVGAAVVVI